MVYDWFWWRALRAPGVSVYKAIYHVKGISYKPVAHLVGGPHEELREWTGQTSAPVAAYNDERIRITWENMLWQAEQLVPEPRLIPENAKDRVAMFGLLREFAGECGFAWDRRLQTITRSGGPEAAPVLAYLARKYGYSEAEVEASYIRVSQLLELCSDTLEEQKAKGSPYYIGDSLTALDIYSAVLIAIMMKPLPCMEQPRNPPDFQWENRDRLYTGYRIPEACDILTGSLRVSAANPLQELLKKSPCPAACVMVFQTITPAWT